MGRAGEGMGVQGHRVPEESDDTNKQTQRVRAEGLGCPSLSPPRMGLYKGEA